MNFPGFSFRDAVDIFVVSFLIYRLLLFLSETRAWHMLVGIFLILLLSVLAKILNLHTLSFIFNSLLTIGIFAIFVIFQPEIRKILARLGEKQFGVFPSEEEAEKVMEEVVRACASMSEDRIGALIVFEREVNLDNYVESGTELNARVSKELLITLFWPGSPLHDGAVILRKDKIHKAGAFLPLSLNPHLPPTMGTRHRAGIGITEETDAVSVIVSEETGSISVAYSGKMIKNLDSQKLKRVLKALMVRKQKEKKDEELA